MGKNSGQTSPMGNHPGGFQGNPAQQGILGQQRFAGTMNQSRPPPQPFSTTAPKMGAGMTGGNPAQQATDRAAAIRNKSMAPTQQHGGPGRGNFGNPIAQQNMQRSQMSPRAQQNMNQMDAPLRSTDQRELLQGDRTQLPSRFGTAADQGLLLQEQTTGGNITQGPSSLGGNPAQQSAARSAAMRNQAMSPTPQQATGGNITQGPSSLGMDNYPEQATQGREGGKRHRKNPNSMRHR